MLSQVKPSKRHPVWQSVTLTLAIALLIVPSCMSGQQGSFNRLVYMTVTDPLNRFVTGLDRDHFDIVESGARRPITFFSSTDEPIAIALVNESPLTELDTLQGPTELIQTRSLSEAVRRLVASGKPRKVLIITAAAGSATFPGGIFVIKTDVNMARKAVVEACNRYAVGFISLDPSAAMEVVLKQPRDLPELKVKIFK